MVYCCFSTLLTGVSTECLKFDCDDYVSSDPLNDDHTIAVLSYFLNTSGLF